MIKLLTTLFAAALAMSPLAAQAQPKKVEPMRFVDSVKPDASQKDMVDNWLKFAEPKNPGGLLYQQYKVGDRTITFMMGQGDSCDGGPNSINSEQTWERCPLTIVSSGKDGTRVQKAGTACFVHVTPRNDPGVDPSRNMVQTAFDPVNKVVEINTLRDGKPVEECARSLAIQ